MTVPCPVALVLLWLRKRRLIQIWAGGDLLWGTFRLLQASGVRVINKSNELDLCTYAFNLRADVEVGIAGNLY